MIKNIFVKVLLLGLFTINLYANFYAKQTIDVKELYVGQIFEVNVETILLQSSQKFYFDFENARGIEIINPLQPQITSDDVKTYHKFYLQAISQQIKTPDIILTIIDNEYTDIQRDIIEGVSLHATKLNPPKNFSNILARSLIIEGFQNSVYDDENNILAIKLFGEYSNLNDFNLTNVKKMEIKDKEIDFSNQTVTLYAIVDKELEMLTFSYFNLNSKTYKNIQLPINIKRDTVSTQTELHPQKSRVYQLKVYGFLSLGVGFLILFVLKRKILFILIAALSFAYLFYTLKPLAIIHVKKDSIVYILPTKNATAIVKTDDVKQVKRLNTYQDYYKVEFENGMIGWIKKENSYEN